MNLPSSPQAPPPGLRPLPVRRPPPRLRLPFLLRGHSGAAPPRLCASDLASAPSRSLPWVLPQRRLPPPIWGLLLAAEAAWRTEAASRGGYPEAGGRPKR